MAHLGLRRTQFLKRDVGEPGFSILRDQAEPGGVLFVGAQRGRPHWMVVEKKPQVGLPFDRHGVRVAAGVRQHLEVRQANESAGIVRPMPEARAQSFQPGDQAFAIGIDIVRSTFASHMTAKYHVYGITRRGIWCIECSSPGLPELHCDSPRRGRACRNECFAYPQTCSYWSLAGWRRTELYRYA